MTDKANETYESLLEEINQHGPGYPGWTIDEYCDDLTEQQINELKRLRNVYNGSTYQWHEKFHTNGKFVFNCKICFRKNFEK
jgi:hypothetical protein